MALLQWQAGTNAFLASHSKLLGTLHVAGSLSPPFFWPLAIIKGFDPRPDSSHEVQVPDSNNAYTLASILKGKTYSNQNK